MSIWDNQQETSWFIGVLEAEGDCINTHLTSGQMIRVSNTDTDIIETCCSFLKKRNITFGLYQRTLKERCKQLVTISVCGKDNCYSLFKYLGNGFQCRQQEFQAKLFGSSTTTRDVSLTSDLHWLTGVFEGEGCFSLDLSRITYAPRIRFVNTNELIIKKY